MTTCIGLLLDISIDNDHAILWINTEDGQILKLRDYYRPGFYILPRNESDGLSSSNSIQRRRDNN
jgi:hypothetical protein